MMLSSLSLYSIVVIVTGWGHVNCCFIESSYIIGVGIIIRRLILVPNTNMSIIIIIIVVDCSHIVHHVMLNHFANNFRDLTFVKVIVLIFSHCSQCIWKPVKRLCNEEYQRVCDNGSTHDTEFWVT
jgi:hypothetical protein